ncbi:MAG: Smr/MutS family protein [Desulfuromonadaceae bacterium]|nr:Smr/MutS family protein [Desulfuromonadaceae bacterium]
MTRKKRGGSDFRDALRALKKSLPVKDSPPQLPKPVPDQTSGGDLTGSFEEEMARLAVSRLGAPADLQPEEELEAEEAFLNLHEPEEKYPVAEDEETLFLSALGNLDRVFHDQVDLEGGEESPSRRLKGLGKRRVVPEDTLDLHGLTRAEALQKVGFFLQKASHNGLRTVLIVTGKGKGSEGEGVLRAAVADFLDNEGEKWISAWGVAPRNLGGEGAVAVFLRSRPRRQ